MGAQKQLGYFSEFGPAWKCWHCKEGLDGAVVREAQESPEVQFKVPPIASTLLQNQERKNKKQEAGLITFDFCLSFSVPSFHQL